MNKLQVKQNQQLSHLPSQVDVIDSILNGECDLPEEVADKFKISLNEAISILNDPGFNKALQFYSTAKANIHFHKKGIKKVLDIINQSEDNKEVLQAVKFIAQYTGNSKHEGNDVNVNLNLGNLIDKADQEKKVSSIDLTEYEKL